MRLRLRSRPNPSFVVWMWSLCALVGIRYHPPGDFGDTAAQGVAPLFQYQSRLGERKREETPTTAPSNRRSPISLESLTTPRWNGSRRNESCSLYLYAFRLKSQAKFDIMSAPESDPNPLAVLSPPHYVIDADNHGGYVVIGMHLLYVWKWEISQLLTYFRQPHGPWCLIWLWQ